jgi:hypothetical protein
LLTVITTLSLTGEPPAGIPGTDFEQFFWTARVFIHANPAAQLPNSGIPVELSDLAGNFIYIG